MVIMGLSRYVIFSFVCVVVAAEPEPNPLSDAFIDLINRKQTTWKAGRNFHEDMPLEHLQKHLGLPLDFNTDNVADSVEHDADSIANLPENFDPRDKWPNCPSLNEIRDQGACGSCWAFGAVEAMTDRVCIFSNGTEQFHFSAEDLISCCGNCSQGDGCDGGSPEEAWEYWKNHGLVSGGNYNSNEGCRPYSIPGDPGPTCTSKNTPLCEKICLDGYNVDYTEDLHYGKRVYAVRNGEANIMAELYKNGPVEAGFRVYDDFFHYTTGVYKHACGSFVGKHAVKILSWGVENGIKYWLVANSWNTTFGKLGGFFKFLRGKNHCGIEEAIITGEPLFI